MRNAVIASASAHVVVTLALLLVRPARDVLVPGPDVVQVALVDAAMAATPPQAARREAPEPVAPQEERGVKLETPPAERARPRPEPAPPAPSPAPPAQAASVVLPFAPMGGGMRGQVAVDESNFEFAYYLQQLRTLIARNWTPPAGVARGTRVGLYFRVSRDGSITAPRVENSSGNAWFDQAAVRAVILAGHLPPLPLGYGGADLGVHFGFEYAGP